MIILAVDAAASRATVAVFRDGQLIAERSTEMRNSDRESLFPTIDGALRESETPMRSVDRVVCGSGPGSFTSLRIAAATVKGLAYGRRIPVDAVPSLALVVTADTVGEGVYLACLDALRGQTYAAGFAIDGAGDIREVLALRLVPNDDVAVLAAGIGAVPIGPDRVIQSLPHARGALRAAALTSRDIDLASWEPTYGRKAEAQVKWEAAHGRALPEG